MKKYNSIKTAQFGLLLLCGSVGMIPVIAAVSPENVGFPIVFTLFGAVFIAIGLRKPKKAKETNIT